MNAAARIIIAAFAVVALQACRETPPLPLAAPQAAPAPSASPVPVAQPLAAFSTPVPGEPIGPKPSPRLQVPQPTPIPLPVADTGTRGPIIGPPTEATAPLVIIPTAPDKTEPLKQADFERPVSPAGYQLILDFEVGGGKKYYERFLIHIEWPGGASGPTGGIGYDFAYNSTAVIRHDWTGLREDWLERLATECPGKTGQAGKAEMAKLHEILIEWKFGEKVFNETTIPRFLNLCRRTYPGFDDLRLNAQASLLSLTFNRGQSMAGPKRVEMRKIRGLVSKKDYADMAAQQRAMVHIWEGTDIYRAMKRRRFAEAELMETP